MIWTSFVPVFQMKPSADGPGWVFPEEDDNDDFEPPVFTISDPVNLRSNRYAFAVEVNRVPRALVLTYEESSGLLVSWYERMPMRFAFAADRAKRFAFDLASVGNWHGPTGYPYVGKRPDVLLAYGKDDVSFIQLLPADSITMDRLYLEHRVVFMGVTANYGPHMGREFSPIQ